MAILERKKKAGQVGLPPGTLVHIGEKKVEKARMSIMDFDVSRFEEKEISSAEECFPFKAAPSVTWINVDGLHDVGVVEKIGNGFGLHPLAMEDILNTAERPKMEDYGDYIFLLLKVYVHGARNHEDKIQQVSLILGPGFVISFQEKETGIFDPVRDRIRKGKGRVRKMGADYLAYTLIDCIVDSYFSVLEKLGDDIESLENELVADPKREILQKIHGLKKDMIHLRKSVWPLREAINAMERLETPLIQSTTDVFLRDVYDHTIQIIDSVETSRDVISGMLETYLSSVSNRMNEVMKVLTIIATIFIPLTFIAGVYGMNFKFMPELEWKWGYFVTWGIMAGAAVLMVIFFRKKKWL
jgi:magnesium transporter